MFGIDDVLSGAVSAVGTWYNNEQANERQEAAQKFNAAEAQKTRDYQERMSNTAYQRGMLDMKTAGLNPILAYQKGPAGSPTGATASTTAAPVSDVIGSGVASARASQRQNAEVQNMIDQNANLRQQTANLKAQEGLTQAQMDKTRSDQVNVDTDTAIKTEAVKQAIREGKKAEFDTELFDTPAGRIARGFGVFGREVNPFIHSAKSAIGR